MAPTTAKRKLPSLKSGRPPTSQKQQKKMSSKATQKTIVSFHQLNKDLALAKTQNDPTATAKITADIAALGGLKAYQAASIQGQSAERGGDSSTVLMQWLQPVEKDLRALADGEKGVRMLEVGALSTKNACSRSQCFEIERIDLNSQDPGIKKQDFMERPLPTAADESDEKFDIISLSLVLNFVPTAPERGEMLKRTTQFLRREAKKAKAEERPKTKNLSKTDPEPADGNAHAPIQSSISALHDMSSTLFLVLPAPCVLNSRYFNDERLALIMSSLGYALLRRKQTAKLVYYLWQWRDKTLAAAQQKFGKVKLRDGATMNNFCVVLE